MFSWHTILFRCLIVLGLAAHVFVMYGTARTMRETFGFDPATTVIAVVFAFFLLLPFLWAVALADVPLMLARHRARRRFQRGCCPACGYRVAESGTTVCSECGAAMSEPPAYEMSWSTLRRFLLLNFAALVLGVVASETWLLLDEHRFKSMAGEMNQTSAPPERVARARIAPFGNASLVYHADRGFSATD